MDNRLSTWLLPLTAGMVIAGCDPCPPCEQPPTTEPSDTVMIEPGDTVLIEPGDTVVVEPGDSSVGQQSRRLPLSSTGVLLLPRRQR